MKKKKTKRKSIKIIELYNSLEYDNVVPKKFTGIVKNVINVFCKPEDNPFYPYYGRICFDHLKNGKLHREDGPAIYDVDSLSGKEDEISIKAYYLNDKELSKEEFWKKQKRTKYASKLFAEFYGKGE